MVIHYEAQEPHGMRIFFRVWRQLAAGKTPMRAFMNIELSRYSLEQGMVLDLGGGKNPSYLGFLHGVSGATVVNIDQQHGMEWRKNIDLECDTLPFGDESVDQVLLLNTLEHVYNYRHVLAEARRVLKTGKTVIGFVPFLITYHADPHDYFRYTHEALLRLCTEAGFVDTPVVPLGLGPFTINLNTLASFLPRYFIAVLWPHVYVLDCILLVIKPSMAGRFPLGYLFVPKK